MGVKGDVDILLARLDRPDRSIAIEVKRIKVGRRAFETGKINRATAIQEGVEQANRLARVGFHHVYLYAIVLVDSREHNRGEWTYGAPSASNSRPV